MLISTTLLLAATIIAALLTATAWAAAFIIRGKISTADVQSINRFFTEKMKWPERGPGRQGRLTVIRRINLMVGLMALVSLLLAPYLAIMASGLENAGNDSGVSTASLYLSAALLGLLGLYLGALWYLVRAVERQLKGEGNMPEE